MPPRMILAPHGTAKRYRQHLRLKEPTCQPCRDAMTPLAHGAYTASRGYEPPPEGATVTPPTATVDELMIPGTFKADPLFGTSRHGAKGCMGDQDTGIALCGATGGRKPTPEQHMALTATCAYCRRALWKGGRGRAPIQGERLEGKPLLGIPR